MTQNNGQYAIEGHLKSLILVPIDSSYATSYEWIILTYVLSCIFSKLLWIIGQMFAFGEGYLSLVRSFAVNP